MLLGPKQFWSVRLAGKATPFAMPRVVAGIGGGDVAALLRLLTKFGRLADAARLATYLFPVSLTHKLSQFVQPAVAHDST